MQKRVCWTVITGALALTLAACDQPAAAPTGPPPTDTPEIVSIIDWVDFVQFGGIQYLAADSGGLEVGRALTDGDLGPEFAKVNFKLDGNVSRAYQIKDGDAAFLDAGTPVYTVKGYGAQFRLAVRREGRLVFYEADTYPQAKTGAHLLDIGGKVRYIGVNSAQDGVTELAAITDPRQVTALVELVLEAPVDQNRQDQGGVQYFIAFHLEDDTLVTRAYWPASGELFRGIMLPKEFRTAVEQAFAATTPAPPGPAPTPAPFPGDFQLTLTATPQEGTAPLRVVLAGVLTGGPDNSYVLYCTGESWDFGDGIRMERIPDCVEWTPEARIRRNFTTEYTYEQAGTYQIRLEVGEGAHSLVSNAVTIEVR